MLGIALLFAWLVFVFALLLLAVDVNLCLKFLSGIVGGLFGGAIASRIVVALLERKKK